MTSRTNLIRDPADDAAIVKRRQLQVGIMGYFKRWTREYFNKESFLAAAAMAALSSAAQAQQATIAGDQPLPYSEHCLGSDALQAAKALYLHAYDFASGDPAKSEGLLDPRLSDRLAKNFACEKDGVCAIETDTWTGAQDGAVAEPITITYLDAASSKSLTRAKVKFAFTFTLEGEKPASESTILEFARNGEGQCWKLFDMTAASGQSLMQQLIDYQDKP